MKELEDRKGLKSSSAPKMDVGAKLLKYAE